MTLNVGKTTKCGVFVWTSGLTHVTGTGSSMLHELGCAFTERVPQRMDQDLLPRWLHNKGAFHGAIICCSVRQAVVAVAQQLQSLMEDKRLDLPLSWQSAEKCNKTSASRDSSSEAVAVLRGWVGEFHLVTPMHINMQRVPRPWICNLKGMAVSRCKILNNLWGDK